MANKSKANSKKIAASKLKGEMKGGTIEGEGLIFDYHTIRLIIGFIAMIFPLIVYIRAAKITDSISWSYYTDARDLFVGFLFVIGAFLISYKGRKTIIRPDDVGSLWKWISRFWKGAVNFRIWEKKHEEDLVGWAGGIAACVTATCPTAFCIGPDCPSDWKSNIHYIGAVVLFSTTIYFCLVAFLGQVKAKIKEDEAIGLIGNTPKKRRKKVYQFCGWGIAIVMLGLFFMKIAQFEPTKNFTFWVEAVALELFGIAWAVASQYLPYVTDKNEQQKLF